MSTFTMQQDSVHTTKSRPPSRDEHGLRLPGVRQLLLSHPLEASQYILPLQQVSAPIEGLPNTASTTLASIARHKQPVHSNTMLPRGQLAPISGIDDLSANPRHVHPHQTPTPPSSAYVPPLQDPWHSPRYQQLSSIQSNRSGTTSPGSNYTAGSVSFDSASRPPFEPYGVERHVLGTGWAQQSQDGPFHREWGTTKAGKPRKRLAQACLNCRQKKIRCDPNPNSVKCTQCEKTALECRFESGSRHTSSIPGRSASSDPHASPLQTAPSARQFPIRSPSGEEHRMFLGDARSLQPLAGTSQRAASPTSSEFSENFTRFAKRQKRSAKAMDEQFEFPWPGREPSRQSRASSQTTNRSQVLEATWAQDTEAEWWLAHPISPLTLEYLGLYFAHINQSTNCMFAQTPFMRWVCDGYEKTVDDKMVLHAMLALGCRFSRREVSVEHGENLLRLARYAEQNSFGRFTLQLAQTRLILTQLYLSLGKSGEAGEYSGATVRAVCGVKYNSEEGVICRSSLDHLDYGLNEEALAECRRRTFWSIYIMDRFNGFYTCPLSVLKKEDCFVRLPCRDDLYAMQSIPKVPNLAVLEQDLSSKEESNLGNMTYLIEVFSAWTDVMQYFYRKSHRVTGREPGAYESFYASKEQQLQSLSNRLPRHLYPCNTQNIKQASRGGYLEIFLSIHAFYHTTLVVLNRYAVPDELEEGSLTRNLRAAQFHARRLLQVFEQLLKSHAEEEHRSLTSVATSFPPTQGYAILSAVDILTSSGTLTELKSDLLLAQSGLEVVQGLSKHWGSGQQQLKLLSGRIEGIKMMLEDGAADACLFAATVPLERPFGRDLDLLYALPMEVRFRALGISMVSREGIRKGVLCVKSLDSTS